LTVLKQRKLVKLFFHVKTRKVIIPTFSTIIIACELLSQGVAAIFGPGTTETSGIVSSIADTVDVPHIITHWDRESFGARRTNSKMTLNVFPDADTLSRAFAELLIDYTWKSYTIIYENDDGLMRLKDILQIHDPESPPITVR
jgi:glutamate receptor, ionotropic, invertebrate